MEIGDLRMPYLLQYAQHSFYGVTYRSKFNEKQDWAALPETYYQAASQMPPNLSFLGVFDKSILAKSYSCIVVALFKIDKIPVFFSDNVNSLFASNGLPPLLLRAQFFSGNTDTRSTVNIVNTDVVSTNQIN